MDRVSSISYLENFYLFIEFHFIIYSYKISYIGFSQ